MVRVCGQGDRGSGPLTVQSPTGRGRPTARSPAELQGDVALSTSALLHVHICAHTCVCARMTMLEHRPEESTADSFPAACRTPRSEEGVCRAGSPRAGRQALLQAPPSLLVSNPGGSLPGARVPVSACVLAWAVPCASVSVRISPFPDTLTTSS